LGDKWITSGAAPESWPLVREDVAELLDVIARTF
jgi:hypothetical protein